MTHTPAAEQSPATKLAFPLQSDGHTHGSEPGMTLREWYAGLAMQGILACDRHKMEHAGIAAEDAAAAADALIAELAKVKP